MHDYLFLTCSLSCFTFTAAVALGDLLHRSRRTDHISRYVSVASAKYVDVPSTIQRTFTLAPTALNIQDQEVPVHHDGSAIILYNGRPVRLQHRLHSSFPSFVRYRSYKRISRYVLQSISFTNNTITYQNTPKSFTVIHSLSVPLYLSPAKNPSISGSSSLTFKLRSPSLAYPPQPNSKFITYFHIPLP